ncbi:MAG: tripartite tricarboxylate transporter TctB family protein [Syntrophomonadaceae bacterium]|nr:tripartite tricarboxylate transporter TctB family protein [Syntrophomonadaceae bacterium]
MKKYQIMFTVAILLVFLWTAWEALGFAKQARFLPLYVSLVAIPLVIAQLFLEIKNKATNDSSANSAEDFNALKERMPALLVYMGWVLGYVLLIYLLGFLVATGIFLFAFLKRESGMTLVQTITGVVITLGFIVFFGRVLHMYWPEGILVRLIM